MIRRRLGLKNPMIFVFFRLTSSLNETTDYDLIGAIPQTIFLYIEFNCETFYALGAKSHPANRDSIRRHQLPPAGRVCRRTESAKADTSPRKETSLQ